MSNSPNHPFSDRAFEIARQRTMLDLLNEVEEWKEFDLLEQVKAFVPQWILHTLSGYSEEYHFLTENWHKLCFQWKTNPQHILLVSFLPLQGALQEFRLLETILNKLAKNGFVIRTPNDLFVCSKCGQKALLHEHIHKQIQARNRSILEQINASPTRDMNARNFLVPIPEIWTSVCSKACDGGEEDLKSNAD